MTVARRRPNALAAIAPIPPVPVVHPPVPELGVTVPRGDVPAADSTTPLGRLRRCTFRRIDQVSPLPGRANSTAYEVMCLYGTIDEPLALGEIADARPICEACTASGIFRPDED